MRLWGFFGCLYVAWDSAEKATGASPQGLFEPDMKYFWWVAVVAWSIAALRFLGERS